jgi:hypothetical protein
MVVKEEDLDSWEGVLPIAMGVEDSDSGGELDGFFGELGVMGSSSVIDGDRFDFRVSTSR